MLVAAVAAERSFPANAGNDYAYFRQVVLFVAKKPTFST
jgi:hypothetical protein